jgi:hypothetical protein
VKCSSFLISLSFYVQLVGAEKLTWYQRQEVSSLSLSHHIPLRVIISVYRSPYGGLT